MHDGNGCWELGESEEARACVQRMTRSQWLLVSRLVRGVCLGLDLVVGGGFSLPEKDSCDPRFIATHALAYLIASLNDD